MQRFVIGIFVATLIETGCSTQGPTGPQGATGPQGVTGQQGSTGAMGPAGAIGATGAAGPQGVPGPTGAAGTAGTAGSLGATGPAGPTGAQGPAGAVGPTGPTAPLVYVHNGKQYGLTGGYCGATAIAYSGNLLAAVPGAANGYAAAKTLCENVSGCTVGAHMCISDEIVRSLAMGVSLPAAGGWYSTGVNAQNNGYFANDCLGWTAFDNQHGASFFAGGAPSFPSFEYCSLAEPVLCCL